MTPRRAAILASGLFVLTGLLWYATYRVGFAAKYRVVNYTNEAREIFLEFAFLLLVSYLHCN